MLILAPVVESVVAEVAPVHGVSIGAPLDKSTWRISFKPEATDQQRAAAAAALASFDVAAEIARQEAAANRITVERLYFFLGLEEAGLDQAVEDLAEQLKQAGNRKPAIYLANAKEFESDHELVMTLGQHPSLGLTPEGIRNLFVAMAAAQAARSA